MNFTLITSSNSRFTQACKGTPANAYRVDFPVDSSDIIFAPSLAIAAPASSFFRCQNLTVNIVNSTGF
jgi:hypothetical protein